MKPYQRNGEVVSLELFPQGMQRIALGVEYAGHLFRGFQSQSHDRQTVQHYLQAALSFIADEPITLVCAGRTDARVHACHQVVHFDTLASRPAKAWLCGANTRLPDGVTIRWMRDVSPLFHARFSATSRTYRYIIYPSTTPSALLQHYVTWERRTLDVQAMRQAAKMLLGEHDFSAFRASQCQARTPVRRLDRLDIYCERDFIVIEVQASAFLYHMVRNIVGVLLAIASGSKPPIWAAEVLASRDRRCACVTAPPDGLYLVDVSYDTSFALPMANKGPYFLM